MLYHRRRSRASSKGWPSREGVARDRDRCIRNFNTFLDANRDCNETSCSYFVKNEDARALDADD